MDRYRINRIIRKQLHMTGAELAERIGMSRQTVSHYETGRSTFRSTERIIELELAIEVSNCTDEDVKYVCELLINDRDKK